MHSFTTPLVQGAVYVRKHPQLLATLILVVIVPLGFLFSGQQFLKASKENQEIIALDKIGVFHDTFSLLGEQSAFEPLVLQSHIEKLASQNSDITSFAILKESNEGIVTIASLKHADIGTFASDLSFFKISEAEPSRSFVVPKVLNSTRYWDSYRTIHIDNETFYVYTEFSFNNIDASFAHGVSRAYIWLFAILIAVMVLLLRHIRLTDYAYLYSEAKKANEMKDLFTNMIAHELRAPLTAIRGYASILRESEKNTSVQKNAQNIEDAAARLVLIISDLLDVARLQSGKMGFKNERTDVSHTITTVIETMQGAAGEKSITLQYETADHKIYAQVDERRLIQALTNLVSNAIKYTKSGSISVSLLEHRDRVEIRVKDTGMGMSAEDQKQLFAPFFRIENTETKGVVGTGLGMWITKQLIELMKGSIGVESIKGVGTHIVITLPK